MAIRTVYGEWFSTADATAPAVYQKLVPSKNVIIDAIRLWVIQYADPTYTGIGLKLYSNNSGVPGSLIATSSTVWDKASLFNTDDYGLTEAYFEFSNVSLKADEIYHLSLYITGYTGSASSHIGWMKSYPDPTYQTDVDMSLEGLLVSPFELVIHGDEL